MPKRSKKNLKEAKDREIAGISIIAVGGLLLACLIFSIYGDASNAVGVIGVKLAGIMKLLAGKASFGVPLFLLVCGAMVFADRYRGISSSRFVGLIFLFFASLGLLHIHLPHSGDYLPEALAGAGGGVLGASLAFLLRSIIGIVGGYIILLALVIIGLLLLTEL
ncbi:MAG: DNA translocase FtsK 4TM domain-containing protein, partial [Clostridiales bacterium]|nr:DNA translocase FtsK 4TM domain-containing protein [Clostridiales bacterium]